MGEISVLARMRPSSEHGERFDRVKSISMDVRIENSYIIRKVSRNCANRTYDHTNVDNRKLYVGRRRIRNLSS